MLTDIPVKIPKNDTPKDVLTLKATGLNLTEKNIRYIENRKLFFAYSESIPNITRIEIKDYEKAIAFVEKKWSTEILKTHYQEYFDQKTKKIRCENKIFVFTKDFMIDIEDSYVYILFSKEWVKKSESIATLLGTKFSPIKEKKQKYLGVLNSFNDLEYVPIEKPKLSLMSHYNDDILPVHKIIIRKANRSNMSGVIMLYGIPGTGKSTYIRYLLNQLDKDIIFLSASSARNMDSSTMMNFLLNHQKSILLIEDAEDLIVSREISYNSGLSVLLSLTDGVLSGLSIQIICTFNTNIDKVDKALLRKGRLIALYEFKPLMIEKSKRLLEKLGQANYDVHSPMTLADIYNIQEMSFENTLKTRQKVGF